MLLFVGLGNPGAKHAGNRHNIGFMVAQAIAKRHDFPPWRRRFQGVAPAGTIGGEKVREDPLPEPPVLGRRLERLADELAHEPIGGLAREHDLEVLCLEPGGEEARLRRPAGSIQTLDGDEQGGHESSVAGEFTGRQDWPEPVARPG